MIGAIAGDIAGSRFEFDNHKSKDFELFVSYDKLTGTGDEDLKAMMDSSSYSDDSVMTLAIAKAILRWKEMESPSCQDLSRLAVESMREFGKMYPLAGYGGTFEVWLQDETMGPYNSWGNGAAMRVSACGWAGLTLDEVKAMSRAVTAVTHNHPEGIKGAEATAVATFLARIGKPKEEIKSVIIRAYYPLDFTLDEIRPGYEFDVSCQGSVPQALEAFVESTSFEDAIRNAVSIGGDSDTIAAICGAVAGAFYGVPDDIRAKAETFLPFHLIETLHSFESKFCQMPHRDAGDMK